MLKKIIKVLLKILKNKNFTIFFALFTLLIISFIVTNQESSITQSLLYIISFQIVRFIIIVVLTFIIYINLELGLLCLIIFSVLLNIPIYRESFDNINNMVDKSKILKYNKNFKEPKKLVTKEENIKKENIKKNDIKNENLEKNDIKKRRKKGYAISEDMYKDNKKNIEKNTNIEEVDLENNDDTIERELKKKHTNDFKKLEEFDSSSSNSSESESSNSSTDSSDSEKEMDDVSMTKARGHMLNKLRNGLKKKYINND
tara:strand:- start:750 stop:1523 length:774 start_codon:yes stop_codon:yes gene_type:complete